MPPKRRYSATSSPRRPFKGPSVTSLGKTALRLLSGDGVLDRVLTNNLIAYTTLLEGQVEKFERITAELGIKSEEELLQLEEETDKLRCVIKKGIKAAMKSTAWSRIGAANFSFEGRCVKPSVMANLLSLKNLEDVVRIKQAYRCEEFQERITKEEIRKNVGLCYLRLTGNLKLRWSNVSGEFRLTGKYRYSGIRKQQK